MSTFPPPGTRARWPSFVGLFIALLGLVGAWFEPVTHPRLSAFRIGIELSPNLPAWLVFFFSYGLIGFLLCLWGVFAVKDYNVSSSARAACSLLLLGLLFYVQLALGRPVWIETAMEGAIDFTRTMNFANKYDMPIAYLISPGGGMGVVQEGWLDRFQVALIVLRYGWYWYMFGAGLLLFSSLLPGVVPLRVRRTLRPVFGIFLLALIFMSAGPVWAQLEARWGDQAAARGALTEAEHHYRRAIACDEWFRVRPSMYLKIGALRFQQGDRLSPESLLYQGVQTGADLDYESAMDQFRRALPTRDATLAALVRRVMADLAMGNGLSSYAQGQQGEARDNWTEALHLRPQQVAAYYMIAQADMDLSEWEEAGSFYQKVLPQSSNIQIRAAAVAGMGDSAYRLGDVTQARKFYFKSLIIEPEMNYRVLKALSEYYYR